MDYKERYNELLKVNKQLEKELDSFRSKDQAQNRIAQDAMLKIFYSSSHLMAINKVDTGIYIDVNNTFLTTLGYQKEEIIGKTSDDIQIFTDLNESNKYIKLISKLNNIKDYPVTLKTKAGEKRPYLFSSEKIQFDNEFYLLTVYNDISFLNDRTIIEDQKKKLDEILETVSSYLAIFSISVDNKFYIIDLNRKAEDIEFIRKNEFLGKCIDDTPLANRTKLVELLHHLRITGEPHKLAASQKGDDSEGYYMGFILTSGNIVVTWEPGNKQKTRDDLNKQDVVFEQFAEMLPIMIYEVDLKGNVIFANQQSLNFLGYSKEDFAKGIKISNVFPESYQQMVEVLKTLKSPGQTASNEYMVSKKDGSQSPIVTHSFGLFYDDKIIRYRGVLTDLSKQKEYENQIIREKAFLENLYNSNPAAISITNPDGLISMINRGFTKLFGYTQEEALNKTIQELIVPDDLNEETLTIKNLAIKNGKEVRQTFRKDKYGNRILVSLIATTIIINNETVAHMGIYRDITIERKNELLKEILFNISSAALKQYNIKEIYPIIVQELNKIWDTNNFFIALYNKVSGTLSLPFFKDEKDKFFEISTEKTITGWVIKQDKPILLRENDLNILEESGDIGLIGTPCKVWMGVPLKVENDIIGVMCLQDYNDENKFNREDLNALEFIANQIAIAIQRRLMIDNLIHARQVAEEAAQAKQLFMSTMSHEIRTPLNEVIGITNLLLQGSPREDQMDYINTLKFSGNHLLTLVNDVLDYNKMESGKIIFEQIQINFNNFLNEIIKSYSFRSKVKNLSFDIRKASNLPIEVIGDPIRLNQILSNLLSNALKFTKEGGISLIVRELERENNRSKLEFTVSDTGIGIPKEKHSSIFERFSQASDDTTRHFGGTGLGLAICKKLIELQGGTISVESEPGKGSSFMFVITLGVTQKEDLKQAGKMQENFTGLEGKKILVAEDNKINFFVANKFLVSWGLIVHHAEDGQLALELLEKEDYDLILMDLHMPVMDGIEATRIIRNSENPKIRDIPIVALTAAIMSENHDKIDDLNINDYVLKPFKPQDLFERIRKHIR